MLVSQFSNIRRMRFDRALQSSPFQISGRGTLSVTEEEDRAGWKKSFCLIQDARASPHQLGNLPIAIVSHSNPNSEASYKYSQYKCCCAVGVHGVRRMCNSLTEDQLKLLLYFTCQSLLTDILHPTQMFSSYFYQCQIAQKG